MKVHLTRSLHIGKNYYPAGVQEIPDAELKTNKFFAQHIKAGHIMDPAVAPRQVKVATNQERADALLEKVFGKQKENATPEEAEKLEGGVKSEEQQAADAAEVQDESQDDASDESSDDNGNKKQKHHKKHK